MNRNDKKSRRFLINGVLLAATLVIFIVYISTNSTWSIGVIVVAVLIAAMSGFQFWLYYGFFNKKK
ncbi:MAG: hypothetical protein LBC82_00050 [Oscillospiraceae bacterium]|jgi:uncharacterized membrane-anchored protein|nr:hypothetical protein [Oscillospiraceae bacterium]